MLWKFLLSRIYCWVLGLYNLMLDLYDIILSCLWNVFMRILDIGKRKCFKKKLNFLNWYK